MIRFAINLAVIYLVQTSDKDYDYPSKNFTILIAPIFITTYNSDFILRSER